MTRTAARISGVGESVQTFPSTTSWPRISARNEKWSGHFLLSTNDTWNIDHCFIKCMEYIQCYSFLVLKNMHNPKGYGKNFKFYGLHVIREVSRYFQNIQTLHVKKSCFFKVFHIICKTEESVQPFHNNVMIRNKRSKWMNGSDTVYLCYTKYDLIVLLSCFKYT